MCNLPAGLLAAYPPNGARGNSPIGVLALLAGFAQMASLVCGWLDLVSASETAAADDDGRGMSATDESYFLRVRARVLASDGNPRPCPNQPMTQSLCALRPAS